MFLGPGRAVSCEYCRQKVGVPLWSVIALVPFLGSIVATLAFQDIYVKGLVFCVGATAMCWIHLKYVPLIKK